MYLSRPERNEKVDNTRKHRGLKGLQDVPVIHLAWYKLEQLFTIVSMTAVDFDLLIIKYSFADSTWFKLRVFEGIQKNFIRLSSLTWIWFDPSSVESRPMNLETKSD